MEDTGLFQYHSAFGREVATHSTAVIACAVRLTHYYCNRCFVEDHMTTLKVIRHHVISNFSQNILCEDL